LEIDGDEACFGHLIANRVGGRADRTWRSEELPQIFTSLAGKKDNISDGSAIACASSVKVAFEGAFSTGQTYELCPLRSEGDHASAQCLASDRRTENSLTTNIEMWKAAPTKEYTGAVPTEHRRLLVGLLVRQSACSHEATSDCAGTG
jgi:hypothetical protein